MTPLSPQIPPDLGNDTRRVDVLIFPDMLSMDVAGPAEVFATANQVVRAAAPPYEIRVVASGGGGIRATSALTLHAEPLPDPASPIDTLVVAGGRGVHAAARDPALLDWLRARFATARRTASVCNGAFLLAAAGLLSGRRAVTHWAHVDRLRRDYPSITVERDPIFVHDRGVWSSAGVTAGIDLTLALVEADLGREVALAVARRLVVFLKRPGGQSQFSAPLDLQSTGNEFTELHGWLAGHLGEDLSLSRLAARAGLSERSFLRRYRAATGLTPARAVERLRIEAARQLLDSTQLPVKRIAARCGFGSEETLRRCFARAQGASPQEYRQRFGAL